MTDTPPKAEAGETAGLVERLLDLANEHQAPLVGWEHRLVTTLIEAAGLLETLDKEHNVTLREQRDQARREAAHWKAAASKYESVQANVDEWKARAKAAEKLAAVAPGLESQTPMDMARIVTQVAFEKSFPPWVRVMADALIDTIGLRERADAAEARAARYEKALREIGTRAYDADFKPATFALQAIAPDASEGGA